jgi:ATP-binding cassette subfamily D (ALD) long-chain fatty acid import protein
LKRYHSFLLTLGLGDTGEEWDFTRIGTAAEKQSVDKELAELRKQLSQVEDWKRRRDEIEQELNKVWVEGSEELAAPAYLETDEKSSLSASTPVVVDGSDILDESQASLLSRGSGEET